MLASPRRLTSVLAVAAALAAAFAANASAANSLRSLGDFEEPVYLTSPASDPNRLFVVERRGVVRVLPDGVARTEPFLDIRNLVGQVEGERGLLGLAFAPDYGTTRRFYVYFADASGQLQLREFLRSAADPAKAEPGSGRLVLSIPHTDASNHNGGTIAFGPDGYLYLGPGDGGGGGDQFNNAQNAGTLLGKLLRIDPRQRGTPPYTVPAGNAGLPRPEIYAVGLRNPFRFSFDRATGDLVIGDVGQGAWEEIDWVRAGTGAGRNFGWSCYEGTHLTGDACPGLPHTPPVIEHSHSDGWSAITGGVVVRDASLTGLTGRYLYGDYSRTPPRSAVLGPAGASGGRDEPGLRVDSLVDVGEDACGHVYLVSLNGSVSRVQSETTGPCPPSGAATPFAAGSDRRAPRLRVRRAKHQRGARRRGVVLSIACDEACALRTRGRLRLSRRGRDRRLETGLARRSLATNARLRVRLRFSKGERRRLLHDLRRGRRPVARISLRARDAAGNGRARVVKIRMTR